MTGWLFLIPIGPGSHRAGMNSLHLWKRSAESQAKRMAVRLPRPTKGCVRSMSKAKPVKVGDKLWVKSSKNKKEWIEHVITVENDGFWISWATDAKAQPYATIISQDASKRQIDCAFSLEQRKAIEWMDYAPKRIKRRLNRGLILTRSQWERIAQIMGYNPEIPDYQQ